MPNQSHQFDMTFASLERMMRAYSTLACNDPELRAEASKLYDHLCEYLSEHKMLSGAIAYALTLALFSLLHNIVESQAQYGTQAEAVN